VGGAKAVSVSGVGLTNPFGVSSVDATNYSVAATGSTTANITPRVLNVYYSGVNRVYDGGTVATVTTTDDRVSGDVFDINLIPHTVSVTTLRHLKPGSPVNLEVDQIARYVERMLSAG
jgi:hypothetical protein